MTDINEMLKFYDENIDFKRYVDACVRTYGKDINHMLQQRITEQYYLYLTKKDDYKNE